MPRTGEKREVTVTPRQSFDIACPAKPIIAAATLCAMHQVVMPRYLFDVADKLADARLLSFCDSLSLYFADADMPPLRHDVCRSSMPRVFNDTVG